MACLRCAVSLEGRFDTFDYPASTVAPCIRAPFRRPTRQARAWSRGSLQATPRAPANLGISVDHGSDFVTGGLPVAYTIVIRTIGSNPVTDAHVENILDAEFSLATWTGSSSDGGACPAANGEGEIDGMAVLSRRCQRDLPVDRDDRRVARGAGQPLRRGERAKRVHRYRSHQQYGNRWPWRARYLPQRIRLKLHTDPIRAAMQIGEPWISGSACPAADETFPRVPAP